MINIAEYFKYTIRNLPREYWYNSLKDLFVKEQGICYTKDGSEDNEVIGDEYYFYKKDLKPDFKGRFFIGDIVNLNIKNRYGYVELVILDIPGLDKRCSSPNYSNIKEYGGSYKAIGIQKKSNKYQVIGSGTGSNAIFTEDLRDENLSFKIKSSDPFINLIKKLLIKDNNKDEINLILDYLWDEYEFDLSKVDLSKEEWKTYYKEEE